MFGMNRKFFAPITCLGVLAVMLVEQGRRVTPQSVEPYHAAAREAILRVPPQFTTRENTTWSSEEIPLPTAAVQLLRPNAYLSRRYSVVSEIDPRDRNLSASLLIVQTRQSSDMVGHYPRNCYPSSGYMLVGAEPSTRTIDGLTIPATEYTFTILRGGRTERQTVYNFLIVPGKGIVPTITEVEHAAEDYQQRYYGAAQYQVVTSGDLPRDLRERIYTTLVAQNIDTIRTLQNADVVRDSGGIPQ